MDTLVSRFALIAAATALCAVAFAETAEYEQPPVVAPASVLPADMVRGDSFRVEGALNGEGMLYSCRLWSRYQVYEVASLDVLRLRVHEISAIDTLEAMQQDPQFVEGMVDYVGTAVSATGQVLRHPVRSIRNVPIGLQKFGEKSQAQGTEETDPTEREILFGREEKRRLAFELGVDPYTDNRELQDRLNAVASNRNYGSLVPRIGSFLIGGGVGAAAIAMGVTGDVQTIMRDKTSAEIQSMVRIALLERGFRPAEVDAFLANPDYSPSHRLSISEAVQRLGRVKGLPDYLNAIQEAPTLEVAIFNVRRIQLAARVHRRARPLTGMSIVRGAPVFFDGQGRAVVALPLDIVYWNPEFEAEVIRVTEALDRRPFDVFITGTATELARGKLLEHGITLYERTPIE